MWGGGAPQKVAVASQNLDNFPTLFSRDFKTASDGIKYSQI